MREPVPSAASLELLRSVAALGSIRQAALAHQISQPAASMRLRTLEQCLGIDLLDRANGRATLTPAGEAVVRWSEDVLDGMERLLVGAAAIRAEGRTHLRVVASMTVAEYLIPDWLHRFRASDPGVTVSLEMGNSQRVAEVMSRQQADVGFVECLAVPPRLRSRAVQPDNLVLVVAPSHPWARRRTPVGAAELARTPLILRESGSGTREVLEHSLRSAGFAVTALVELGSTTAIKAAVAQGTGPAVLSRLATDADLAEGRLVVVGTEGLALERMIRAVWSPERTLSPLAKRLIRRVSKMPAPSQPPGGTPALG
ncbi:MAG: LysR family transcriptional regulator [Actinomycetota bacterium]